VPSTTWPPRPATRWRWSSTAAERDLQAARAHVAFAPDADDAIAARAEPGLTVVTSDRDLAGRARAAGAEVVGARALLARL
jgi:uncharacterized protein YaiI (UPF0178 family)